VNLKEEEREERQQELSLLEKTRCGNFVGTL